MVVGTLSHIDDPVQACITVSLKSALYQTYSKTRRYFSTITKKCITLILTAKMASVEGTTYSHSIKTFFKTRKNGIQYLNKNPANIFSSATQVRNVGKNNFR